MDADVFIEPIGRLMNEFSKLPGVGGKTAQRYAYRVIDMSESEAKAFADAILAAKRKVRFCKVCGNFTEEEVCSLCRTRDKSVICVVKEPKDVIALEKIREYKGAYHVLHGVLDPMNGKSPDDIRVGELLSRIKEGGVKEVIMATDTDVTGEATAMYVANLLKPLGITVTRIARGVPIGSELEYADEVTLSRALLERKEM
ncbi:MAG: recombination protein RecR [Clostridia bacterium]|jgi:recombination protein RecR|nr:recombination protein RecR [Clostridia bacterium]